MKAEKKKCAGETWAIGRFFPCQFKALEGGDFCKHHDPVIKEQKVAARDKANKEKWAAEDRLITIKYNNLALGRLVREKMNDMPTGFVIIERDEFNEITRGEK